MPEHVLIPVKENIYRDGECIAAFGTTLTEKEAEERGILDQIKPPEKPADKKAANKKTASSGKETS